MIFVIVYLYHMKTKKKSSLHNKLDEKGSEDIQMMTKDSDGWKYKKLEDADGDDFSNSTTIDEHKKMLN